ncbi:MAG: hypothetical protein DBW91_01160 [Candidatus Thioglobus sp.]|nr:MAG: hypothetical protein DBW91_01160 [Candidatus Thioglobus sp.]|tara:strand:- start:825 stop:1052 length:228 start_codon:yes stop_codon:yes gene_type:complete
MEYCLKTDTAQFEIRQEPLGLWDLWVDGMPTITFESPEVAALSVYHQRSGYVVWDQLEQHDAPATLAGWTKIETA